MKHRFTKKDVEKINAIVNSYGLTEEDFNNRAKMDELCLRLESDLKRIGLSLDCLFPIPITLKRRKDN